MWKRVKDWVYQKSTKVIKHGVDFKSLGLVLKGKRVREVLDFTRVIEDLELAQKILGLAQNSLEYKKLKLDYVESVKQKTF